MTGIAGPAATQHPFQSCPPRWQTILLVALLGIMPVTIMTGQALPSPVFYISSALALWIAIRIPAPHRPALVQDNKLILISMALPLLVTLFSMVWHQKTASANLEIALRLLLGTWVLLLAAKRIAPQLLWQAVWGYIFAAFIATATIFYLAGPELERPYTNHVYNAVGYGDHTIMLGVMALFSCNITISRYPRLERAIKLIVAVLALAAFVITQTRSAWVAIPFYAVIAAVLFVGIQKPKRFLLIGLVSLLGASAVFLSSDTLRDRALLGYEQLATCHGDASTTYNSVCIRLQLWRSALHITKNHPIAGIGDKREFRPAMIEEALPQGLVSETVAKDWGEPHSDFMLSLATFGIPGGLAWLFLMLGPSWLFARRLVVEKDPAIRTAAALGLVISIGFLVCGLFETMFRGMRTASYFAMSIALFTALSTPQHDK